MDWKRKPKSRKKEIESLHKSPGIEKNNTSKNSSLRTNNLKNKSSELVLRMKNWKNKWKILKVAQKIKFLHKLSTTSWLSYLYFWVSYVWLACSRKHSLQLHKALWNSKQPRNLNSLASFHQAITQKWLSKAIVG